MGIATTIARRSLLQRPGRTFFSICGIALGIATAVGGVTLDHSTVGSLISNTGGKSGPDLEIRPSKARGEPDIEGVVDLTEIDGVESASRFFQNDAMVRGVRSTEEPPRVRLYALEAASFTELDIHRLVAGRDLTPGTSEREVLIGAPLAESLGVDVGDTLLIARPKRVGKKACVEGEIRAVRNVQPDNPPEVPFQIVGVLGRELLGRRAQGMVVLVDFEQGEDLYRGAHIDTRYWAKRDPEVDLERLQSTLGRSYSYEMNKSVVIGQAADERAFRTGIRMAGLLALVLGLYVIFHTLSMSLAERVREVATLHALGTTKTQIARVFLIEAVILAGFGAVLGLASGIGLAYGLSRVGFTTLGSGKYISEFLIPWPEASLLAGAGFVIALAGSVYPLSRLGGTSTVAALRGEEALKAKGMARGFHLFSALLLAVILPGLYFVAVPVVGEYTGPLIKAVLTGVGLLAVLIVLPLLMPAIIGGACSVLAKPFTLRWPLAGRLASRTMQQSPTRIAVSASAIAIVAAGLVGLKGMTASLRGEIEVWAEEAVTKKVWIKNLPNVKHSELARHALEFPGVLGVEQGSARTYVPFLMVGIDIDQLTGYGPCKDNPELVRAMKTGHGLIFSRRLADDLDYEVGDKKAIAKADGSVQDFTVVAISDAYGYFPHPDERMYCVAADEYVRRYFCLDVDTVTDVAIRMEKGADFGVARAAVRDFLSQAESGGDVKFGVERGESVLRHHLHDIGRDFILFDVLIVLTAALAALGILNGQLLAALERSKEVGILKALGVARGQITGMVLLESLVVGVIGGGIGLVLGAAVTPVIVDALQELAGLALPHRGAGVWHFVALFGAVLVAVTAGIYPVWRMNRVDAVRAVRTG